MSDIIDTANDTADLFLADSLTHRQTPAPIPKGIGLCLECLTDLNTDRRWCDATCRDEWERAHVPR
jgi:hypothetical protein